MFSLTKLILKTNIKSPIIAFPLLMPAMFLLILSSGWNTSLAVTAGITSIFAVTTMQTGLMGFGFTFINLKKSILLKRIGASKLSKTNVLFSVAFYGLFIWAIQIIWLLFLVNFFGWIGLFPDSAKFDFGLISWPVLIIAMFLGLITSYPIGMFFVSVSKSDDQFSMLVMFYFFLAVFLAGMLIPSDVKWMKDFAYIIPNSYNSKLFIAAGSNVSIKEIFDFKNGFGNLKGWEAALNIFVPIITMVTFSSLSVKLLKWDN